MVQRGLNWDNWVSSPHASYPPVGLSGDGLENITEEEKRSKAQCASFS